MTYAQRLLLETISGHLALLETNFPRKANTQTVKRAKRCVTMRLRACNKTRLRLAA